MGNAIRTPNLTWCSYGAIDTIVYPTGGYTAFRYGQTISTTAEPWQVRASVCKARRQSAIIPPARNPPKRATPIWQTMAPVQAYWATCLISMAGPFVCFPIPPVKTTYYHCTQHKTTVQGQAAPPPILSSKVVQKRLLPTARHTKRTTILPASPNNFWT